MKLSICCITYNHEKYIKQALQSFLCQKVDFEYEIVIGDDFSTDKTLNICKDLSIFYKNDNFIILDSTENLGMMPNFIRTLKACTGEYIALCDGDDFWIDNEKLQKQIDFLENNSNYVFTSSNNSVLINGVIENESKRKSGSYRLEEILLENSFFHTSSVVFRNTENVINELPAWYKEVYAGDMFLFFLVLLHGKAFHFEDTMCCYRIHNTSVTNSTKLNSVLNNCIKYLTEFNILTNGKFNKLIERRKNIFKMQFSWQGLSYHKRLSFLLKNFHLLIINRKYFHPLLFTKYVLPDAVINRVVKFIKG